MWNKYEKNIIVNQKDLSVWPIVLKKLENLDLTILAKVIETDKLFGSVTNLDISKKLLEEGFEIEKNSIILSSNIKKTGKYSAKIRLHREVNFELFFEVVSSEK